jgi:ribonuclease HI
VSTAKNWKNRSIKRVGKNYDIDHQAFTIGLHIFSDGACEPNPGPGGWGVVVFRDGVEVASFSGGHPDSTNNRMEMTGLLRALEVAFEMNEPCIIWSDSQYAVKGANEWSIGWKRNGWQRGGPKAEPKNRVLLNADLWPLVDKAKTAAPLAKIKWCKGHAGIAGNERADELSMQGLAETLKNSSGISNENNGRSMRSHSARNPFALSTHGDGLADELGDSGDYLTNQYRLMFAE